MCSLFYGSEWVCNQYMLHYPHCCKATAVQIAGFTFFTVGIHSCAVFFSTPSISEKMIRPTAVLLLYGRQQYSYAHSSECTCDLMVHCIGSCVQQQHELFHRRVSDNKEDDVQITKLLPCLSLVTSALAVTADCSIHVLQVYQYSVFVCLCLMSFEEAPAGTCLTTAVLVLSFLDDVPSFCTRVTSIPSHVVSFRLKQRCTEY